MNVLLTGATGFVGSALLTRLVKFDAAVSVLVRLKSQHLSPTVTQVVADLLNLLSGSGCDSLAKTLQKTDVIVHAAARAHIMKDEAPDPLTEYRRVNVESTLNLARQAAKAGVKRFIYVSSIKVNGEETVLGKPFTVESVPDPEDFYGLSKWEAEQGLQQYASETEMEIVIIRPPLVYGPLVKGNFVTILNLIKKDYPLPLASIAQNRRSLIALDNLVDFTLLCADYKKTPQAANQTFVISDGEDVSTAELFHRVAKAYGKKSRLFPFPVYLLCLGAKLLGKKEMVDRLLGSLQVDSSKARELLGWKPVVTMDEQLLKMAKAEGYPK